MARRHFTAEEKLGLIEGLIEQWRVARNSDMKRERDVYLILKAIADDYRAQMPGAPGQSLAELQGIVIDVQKSATVPLGYDIGQLRRLAERVMGLWPVIRIALERFENAEGA